MRSVVVIRSFIVPKKRSKMLLHPLKESVSSKDIEKYIVAALAAGVKKYSDKNPELKKTFGNVIGAITGRPAEYAIDDEDDYEEDARPAPRRAKGKNNSSRRSR